MLLSLSLFLVAFLLTLFISVTIRIIYNEAFVIEIEIQPLKIVLSGLNEQADKKAEKKGKKPPVRKIIRFITKAIPYSKIEVKSLNINVSASKIHSAYTRAAITTATLYPVICLVMAYAEKLTIEKSPLISSDIDEKASLTPSIDVSFDLRLYNFLILFIRYFPRSKKEAGA